MAHVPATNVYPSAQRHSATATAPGSDLVFTGQGVQAVLPSEFLNEFAGHGAQRPASKEEPGAHTHAASAVLPPAEVAKAGQVWMRACGEGVVATVAGLARAGAAHKSTAAASQARAGIVPRSQRPK